MAEWKIVSTTDPNLDNVKPGSGPGEYIFTPPTDIARNVYTIYYIDGDISGETEYIVSSADCFVDECATNFYPPPVCFDPDDERYTECSRMTVGHDYGNVNTKYTIDPCWKLIGTSKTNNITGIVVNNDGTSNIAYSDNNTRENIQSVATYKFKNEKANITAESFVTIIQEPNKCYLEDCSSTNVPKPTANVSEVPSTGGNVTISYSETECWEYKTSEITAGNGQVSSFANNVIAVKENESSASDITITAKYTFKNRTSGVECYPTVDVTQKGVDPCKIDHECPTVQGSDTYEVSAAGASGADAIKITYSPEKNSCWTLAVTSGGDTNQIDSIVTGKSSTTITVKPNTDGSTKTMTVTFTFTNTMAGEYCGKTITITQAAGCVCNCNNVVKILNEYGYVFYTYSGEEQLANVPFAILSKNKNLDCDITANKASDTVSQTGIISIGCVKYTNSDTRWSYELKNYCNEKIDESPNDDLYIIYGDLGATVSQRALGFTYTVCGKECTDHDDSGNPIPYYVFQRCACGMDNCRNVYGGGSIIEDRPEFLMECDCGWLQYDSICVESLSCVTAYYYTRTFSTDADISADIAVESAKDQVYTGPTVWIRKETSDGTQLDTLNEALKNDEISRHPENVLVLHKDENNNDMLAISSAYLPSSPLPLKSGVYYIVNAPKKDMVEQVWEVKFATSSPRIIGGDDNGRCALREFYATIYKAPAGWDYVKGDIDKNNKRRKRKCEDPNCGCVEA